MARAAAATVTKGPDQSKPNAIRPDAWRVKDACRQFGISRTTLYELRKQGKLKMIAVAGRALVPDCEVRRLTSLDEAA